MKRSFSSIASHVATDELKRLQDLNIFTAQKDFIVFELKKSIAKIPSIEELLYNIMGVLTDKIDEWEMIGNSRKHSFVKVKSILILLIKKLLALSLYIMDGEGEEKDLFKRKKMRFERYIKIFKVSFL